jgi:hypothetical protein
MQRCRATECIVPQLTTQQAAELTGKNRTTIWRSCKGGRLSATRTDTGDYLIDLAELERVYGTLRLPQPTSSLQIDALQPDASPNETNALQREVELLREQVRMLVADKDDLRAERDRLLGVLERQTDQVKLLTDERQRERQEATAPSLFRWFRRRS